MKKFRSLVMILAFVVSVSAQDVPKKPEAIPPSEATAPAESNIPIQEQKPVPAKAVMQQKSEAKAVQGKKRLRTATKANPAK